MIEQDIFIKYLIEQDIFYSTHIYVSIFSIYTHIRVWYLYKVYDRTRFMLNYFDQT